MDHAHQARVYAEMAGVNTVVVESTDDYAGLLKNLAFTLSLYSGQMCTTTQNLLVPKGGIATDQGAKSFEQFGADLAAAVDTLLTDPRVASAILGVVCAPQTIERLGLAPAHGRTVLASRALAHPQYGSAQLRTPLILALSREERAVYSEECFGPVSYLIATDSAADALGIAEATLRAQGALTLGVYSSDAQVVDQSVALGLRTRVALSVNLTQGVYVNQSAAFSDYHATGGNPAANASYTSLAFVADRFVVVQRRAHEAAPSAAA